MGPLESQIALVVPGTNVFTKMKTRFHAKANFKRKVVKNGFKSVRNVGCSMQIGPLRKKADCGKNGLKKRKKKKRMKFGIKKSTGGV